MSALWQYVASGLSNGCVYALIALGFVLIANVTQVYNFAQGQYVMVGGMILVACEKAAIPTALCVVLAVLATSGVALAQERLTVAPVRNRTSLLGLVVIALGFGTLLQGGALLLWGKDPLSVNSFTQGTFHLFGAALDKQTYFIWGTTIVALAAVVVLFRYTTVGRAMRACAMNPQAARLSGIRAERMSVVAFVLGGALTGLVGAMIVPLSTVSWSSGVTVGLVGFIAAAVAGFSNPIAAVAAGLGLGVVETVAAGEISSSYNEAIVYGVLVVYLLVRDLTAPDGVLVRLFRGGAGGHLRRHAHQRLPRAGGGRAPAAVQPARPRLHVARPSLPGALTLLLVVLLILVPFAFSTGGQAFSSANFIVLSAIGATGLMLVMGLSGQFSLGQAAFYLLSGYVVAILTTKSGWNPVLALVVGTLFSVAGGLVIGWLTLRLKGFNLAIATLAFHLIFLVVAAEWVSETGGPAGIIGVPFLTIFGINFSQGKAFFWLALAVLCVCLLIARNLTRSRMGRALKAISADEEAAESLGVNAFRLKLIVFALAAGMAGVAGGLWAYYLQFAVSSNWDFSLTIALITYAVVGGISSPYGGLVGALVVGTLQYYVRYHAASGLGDTASDWETLMDGAFLVVFLLLFRNGLVPVIGVDALLGRARSLRGRFAGAPPGSAAVAPPGATAVAPPERSTGAATAAGTASGAGAAERLS